MENQPRPARSALGSEVTAANWAGERSRRAGGRRRRSSTDAASGCETPASLGATGIEDRATAARSHPDEKAVRALALDDRGLVGTFGGHEQDFPTGTVGRREDQHAERTCRPQHGIAATERVSCAAAKSPLLEAMRRVGVKPLALRHQWVAAGRVHRGGHVIHRIADLIHRAWRAEKKVSARLTARFCM